MTLDNVGFVRCGGGVWSVLAAALKLLDILGFQLSCLKKGQGYIIRPRMRFFFFPFILVVYLALFDYLPKCIYQSHPCFFFNLMAEESQFMLDLYAIYPASINQIAYD